MNIRPGFWDYFLVLLQLALIVIFLTMPGSFSDFLEEAMMFIGAAPMVTGGGLIIWSLLLQKDNLRILPTPAKDGRLITRGIYKFIRHPIYSGIVLLAIGYAAYYSSFYHLLMALVLFLFFDIKASYEERKLLLRFHEYWDYKVRTGKFFPIRVQVSDTDKAYDSQDVPLELNDRTEQGSNEETGHKDERQ